MKRLMPIICVLFSMIFLSTCAFGQSTSTTNPVCTTETTLTAGPTSPIITGVEITDHCSYGVSFYFCIQSNTNTTSCSVNSVLGSSSVTLNSFGLSAGINFFLYEFECPKGYLANGSINLNNGAGAGECVGNLSTNADIPVAILPDAVALEAGTFGASVAATLVSTVGDSNCVIQLPVEGTEQFSGFNYQQINPSTGAPIGSANATFSLPANSPLSFVLAFSGVAGFPGAVTGQQFLISCGNAIPLFTEPGIGSIDVDFSSTPIANIDAIAATTSGDGILTVPNGGASAFVVATDNTGNASGTVTVEADTGSASLPLVLTICQTNASTGACMSTPTTGLSLTIAQGATPTFAVFATARGTISLNEDTNRVFLRFKINGFEVGATSVAVQT